MRATAPGASNYRKQADLTETPLSNTTVTSGVGAFTKGAYVEVDASTAEKVIGIIILVSQMIGGRIYIFDVATGGAGSETPIINNILFDADNVDHQGTGPVRVEVEVAQGTRLAIRSSSTNGSEACKVTVILEMRS